MLDFRMETFLAVCRHMNLTRAAEELHITQPAVSQHIRFLEKHYKTKLLRSEGKRLLLTEAGEMLRGAAVTMMHNELSLQSEMLRLDEGSRDVRFGATETVGETVMAEVLRTYLERFPDVQLHMETGSTEELLARLSGGEIDFALVEGFFKKSEYDFLRFSAERMIAVCSSTYLFPKQPECIEDLLGERLLLQKNGSGAREVMERALESENHSIEEFAGTAEIGSLRTMKELAKMGCGITFLYETAVREELKNDVLKEIKLKDFRVRHDFTFLWRKGSIYGNLYRELFAGLAI